MDAFDLADDLGPHKVIHVHEPRHGLKAILVVDNLALGPAIGGLRMAHDVSLTECFRLARAMTLKNAAAGLRHGGGKSVLIGDPRMPPERKQALIRCFAAALGNAREYIFGPDMGTDETAMGWVHDEIGRAVGLPRALGGIPLDEIGATGWGVFHAADVAQRHGGVPLDGARFVVQGFGAVGIHAARFLARAGARMVGVSDSSGALIDAAGLDVEALATIKRAGRPLATARAGGTANAEDLIGAECEIWIPAARPDAIDAAGARRMRARLVIQGANVPATAEAERILHERGILCIPDFIANAGGVICAAMEYAGATEAQAMAAIEARIRANTIEVLDRARDRALLPRQAATELALERLRQAMALRRWSTFPAAR